MRHGSCSTHPDDRQQPGATPTQPGACPFAGYSSVFGAGAPPAAATRASEACWTMAQEVGMARASGVDDLPQDSEDPGQSHGAIPAGYTYFAQLVIHDLTHSVALAALAGAAPPLRNLSTPNLDLDTIYGGGPMRCPHLYQPPRINASRWVDDGQYLFHLGRTAKAAFPQNWRLGYGLPLDLPRIDGGVGGNGYGGAATPLVHDDRNDDNLVLAQLTAQFLLTHNAVAGYLRRNGDPTGRGRTLTSRQCFALARHFMLKAYRRIVLHDLLKRLLLPAVHEALMQRRLAPYQRLPVEFLFGAARVGHAMVRAAYTINDHISLEAGGLGRLMSFSGSVPGASLPLPADWAIDWAHLFEIEASAIRPQNARRISPFLAPAFVYPDLRDRPTRLEGSLSFHDLWRCYQYEVPSGQECARQCADSGAPPILSGDSMLPTDSFIRLHRADKLVAALQKHPEFLEQTPLSYYLLQEAAVYGMNGRYLGPVGSEIFARTVLFALATPPDSPPEYGGLTFDDLCGAGIDSLPQLLRVPDMTDVELAETIATTLQ